MIVTEYKYMSSLKRFDEVFQARVGAKESNEADTFAILITDYEDLYYSVNEPGGINN